MTSVSDFLDSSVIEKWLKSKPEYLERVGEIDSLSEVGDGNLNFVWIVKGTKGAIVAKKLDVLRSDVLPLGFGPNSCQAPPFVRILPDWTLKAERAWYEYQLLLVENKWAPGLVPEVYGYDEETKTVVMEFLTPHIILRRGLIAATEYPLLGEHIAEFLAQTLFHTSDLYLPNHVKRQEVKKFQINELVHLTEQVIFHEPYTTAPNNKWTNQPCLNEEVKSLQTDSNLKVKVGWYHHKFQNEAQALLHGDLHTGSIMVTQERTSVIDPEFGYFGPMGFDIGSFLANILMSFYSQAGWQDAYKGNDREIFAQWLLKVVEATWDGFASKFKALWENKHEGALYANLKGTPDLTLAQEAYIKNILTDTLAYTGIEMIRRIVGVASVADFETIPNEEKRAACEVMALKLARNLVMECENYKTIQEVIAKASEFHSLKI